MEDPPGVLRAGDLDVLLRPHSRGLRSPVRSPPRVPDLHVVPPPNYLPPPPPRDACMASAVPSLAANVPFYHVPGPLADHRRNLRHSPQLPGVAVEAARLTKKSAGLLCGPSTWTLSLQSRGKGAVRWRFLAVLLLVASVSAAGGIILMLLTTLANHPIEVVTEFRMEAIANNESNDGVVSVISGEFLFPRVDFNPALHDTDSEPFKLLALQIKEKLDNLFYSSDLAPTFNGSTIYAFRPAPLGEGLEVLCHLMLVITEAPSSEAEEPANRAGLAFLRGLRHHEGHMWLGKWIVDVQSIVFSGYAARGAFRKHHSTGNEVGWTSWGPWSVCGPGGVQTRSRKCALKNGTGVALKSAEQCLQSGGGDLQIKDCTHTRSEAVVAVWRAPRPEPKEPSAVRLCDECVKGEVCVALVGEPVPSCRAIADPADPTGCGGLCKINTEFCRQLDKDAFRCTDDSHCLESEWRCANKLCIPKSSRCDGHMNCYDHSDEFNCGCNLLTHFHCGNRTSCLPLSRRCNGVVDCWDATDETNCTAACASPAHFTCSDGHCVPHGHFCDGLADCPDRSDEPFGCSGGCKSAEFRCRNGRCIRRLAVCDGFDTCGDGSDEEAGCTDPKNDPDMFAWATAAKADRAKLMSCPRGQFRCASGECVLETLRCDGSDDCGDKSDEAHCLLYTTVKSQNTT